jgi:hypothetical protein
MVLAEGEAFLSYYDYFEFVDLFSIESSSGA